MNHAQSNDKYKIKVNRLSSDNDNLLQYSKYLKNDYPKISKIAPKNPILYKVKYKPEIIINEYHQTSNNINTNINIKTNKSKNNINQNNSRNNNFNDKSKNFPFNKRNDGFLYNNSLKDEDNNKDYQNFNNNNKSYNQQKILRTSDYLMNKVNKSEKNLNENNNSNSNSSAIFSPFSNGYSVQSKESEYKKRNLKYVKDNNYNNFNKYNKRIPSFIFQSPMDTKGSRNFLGSSERSINNTGHNMSISNNYIENESNNIYNPKYSRNITDIKQNTKDEEMINVSNALNYRKYNKRNKPFANFSNLYNRTAPDGSESSIESLKNKPNNKMNNIVYSIDHYKNNYNFENKKNKLNNSNIIKNYSNTYINEYNNNNDHKDSLNLKLEHYRIKLFREFMKHFEIFYKSFIRKNFYFFIKNIKPKRRRINNNKSFIYSRKNFLRNNTIENYNTHRAKQASTLSNSNSYGNEFIDIFKTSTMRDYYKLYNQLRKNRNLNQSLNQINKIFNSYSFNNDINDSNNNTKSNNSILMPSKSRTIIKSAPRINRNESNLSSKKYVVKKAMQGPNSISPSFRVGNKNFVNNEIYFGKDVVNRENELYRNSKELYKKYEQIQRRKKKSLSKNKENNINKTITNNKSMDIYKINHSNDYNQFVELRKYMKDIKKENNLKENSNETLNVNRNKKNKMKSKYLIRISTLDDNSNSEIDYNENRNINRNTAITNKRNNNENFKLNFNKTYYNYHYNMDKFKKNEKNNDNNIKKNDEKEEKNKILRKNKSGLGSKKKFINTNTINYFSNNNINNNININNINNNFNNKAINNKDIINNINNKINNNINNDNNNNNFNKNNNKNNDENLYKKEKIEPINNNDKSYGKVKVNINKKYFTEINKLNKNNNFEYNTKYNSFNNFNTISNINNNNGFAIKKSNSKPILNYSNNNSINNKNMLCYTKKKNIPYPNKQVSTLIKDIHTRDKRIHININYYEFTRRKIPLRLRYNFLHKSDTISVNLLADINNVKRYSPNLNFRLTAIQEEENSVQNSKYYDEAETFGNNNNLNNYNNNTNNTNNNVNINNNVDTNNNINANTNANNNKNNNTKNNTNDNSNEKKNYVIYNNKEIIYVNLMDILDTCLIGLSKRKFFHKIKSLNKTNTTSIDNYSENNTHNSGGSISLNNKVYSKKRGVLNNKLVGDSSFTDNNNKVKRKKYMKRVINKQSYEERIHKFRNKLIKYILRMSK